MSPAFVQVVGAVCADRSRQGLAEDANAAVTRGDHLLAGATTHHMHYVQRTIDLSMQNFGLIKNDNGDKRVLIICGLINIMNKEKKTKEIYYSTINKFICL